MPNSIDVFLQPVRDGRAQVAIVALLVLALLDVLFGFDLQHVGTGTNRGLRLVRQL